MNQTATVSKRLLMVNSASSLAARILNITVLIWLYQYLLTRISTEEYAILPVVYSVMMFAPLLSTILTGGLARYTTEAWAAGNTRRMIEIITTMFPLLLLAAFALMGGGALFIWKIDAILNVPEGRTGEMQWMMGLMLVTVAMRLPLSPFSVGLYVQQRFVLYNLIAVGSQFLRMALLFALLVGLGPRVLWVVVAQVIADTVCLFGHTIVSMRLMPELRMRAGHHNWSLSRQVVGFGGWNFVVMLADTIRTSADALILNKFATALDVTCFHLASIPLRQLQQTSYAMREPLIPALTTMYARGELARMQRTYLRGGKLGLWGFLAPTVPLMIYGRELFTLYVGVEYELAGTVMLLLLMLFPIIYGSVILPDVARAMAKVKPWAIISLVSQMVNLVLTIYLVKYRGMGAIGSALSTLIVLGVSYPIFLWPLGLKMLELRPALWFRDSLGRGLLPGLLGAVCWLGLKFAVHPTGWTALGVCGVVGGVVYLAVCWWMVDSADREDLRRVREKISQKLGRLKKSGKEVSS